MVDRVRGSMSGTIAGDYADSIPPDADFFCGRTSAGNSGRPSRSHNSWSTERSPTKALSGFFLKSRTDLVSNLHQKFQNSANLRADDGYFLDQR